MSFRGKLQLVDACLHLGFDQLQKLRFVKVCTRIPLATLLVEKRLCEAKGGQVCLAFQFQFFRICVLFVTGVFPLAKDEIQKKSSPLSRNRNIVQVVGLRLGTKSEGCCLFRDYLNMYQRGNQACFRRAKTAHSGYKET